MFLTLPRYLNILTDDTFEWAIVLSLHCGNESLCSHSSLSKAASTDGKVHSVYLSWPCHWKTELAPPSLPRFTALVFSLELGDFNLSKLFTSMPPRLLLVCHEGADR